MRFSICCTSISPSTRPTSISRRSPTSQRFQQALLVGQAHADVRGDGVGQARRLVDAGQRLQQLRRQLAVGLDVLLEQRTSASGRSPRSRAVARLVRVDFASALPCSAPSRSVTCDALTRDRPSTSTLMVPSGSFSSCSTWASVPTGYRSAGAGIVGLGRLLRDQQDLLVGRHRLFQRVHRLVAADEQRDDHVREHHHVAQRQDGQVEESQFGERAMWAPVDQCGMASGHASTRIQKQARWPRVWGQRLPECKTGLNKLLSIQHA